MGIASPSKRLEAIPPYKFQELEQQIADKRDAGIDVISLGIGDPDQPTYPHVVETMREAVADPAYHQYPSNRGRDEFRAAMAEFYDRRFGVEIDPKSEVIPAIGAKECIYNLCFAFLDPGDVALASDPGYPVYTGGPVLAGASGAAVTAFLRGAPNRLVVELEGGELQVEIGEALAVRLDGWAEPVFAGELSPELLQALAELDG